MNLINLVLSPLEKTFLGLSFVEFGTSGIPERNLDESKL